jgi:hypothetical protein
LRLRCRVILECATNTLHAFNTEPIAYPPAKAHRVLLMLKRSAPLATPHVSFDQSDPHVDFVRHVTPGYARSKCLVKVRAPPWVVQVKAQSTTSNEGLEQGFTM